MSKASLVERVARVLGLPVDKIERLALEALIEKELRRVRAEKAAILAKYGVRSFEELWKLIEEDAVADTEAHDDITRLDYLEHLEEQLEELLKELRSTQEKR